MSLLEAVIRSIAIFGREVLTETRFINVLSDYHGFDEMPAARYIIRRSQQEGYINQIIEGSQMTKMQISQIAKRLNASFGFDIMITYSIIDCLVTALSANLSIEASQDDLNNAITDDYGVKYSKDGLRLLFAPSSINRQKNYVVRQGTLVIANRAFTSCLSFLPHIVLPESLLYIGNEAFLKCDGMRSIEFPKNLISIGDRAFASCHALQSIILPKSLQYVGEKAFNGCRRAKELIIKNAKCQICEGAFKNCMNLENISLPEGMILIGNGMFGNCKSLKSISLPQSIEKIDSMAFYRCESLEQIEFPERLTYIGSSAFSKCSKLTSLQIHDGISHIGKDAFTDCSSLTSISVGINNQVYDSRNNCNAIIESSSNTLMVGCENTEIPDSVLKIDNCAFSGRKSLSSIKIPSGIKSIGKESFKGCMNLLSISLPDSVTVVGDAAFKGCISLSEIKLPIGITVINQSTFEGCRALASIVLPNTISVIEQNAFYGCIKLLSVCFPDRLATIGDNAFNLCISLRSITLPYGLSHLGSCPFPRSVQVKSQSPNFSIRNNGLYDNSCHNLIYYIGDESTIDLQEGLKHIGKNAFSGCKSLQSISIPKSVEAIDSNAFFACNELRSVSISSCTVNIQETAFVGCYRLSTLYIPMESKKHFESMLPQEIHSLLVENTASKITAESMIDYTSRIEFPDLYVNWADEFGVKYSHDRMRLIKGNGFLTSYTIRPGTKVICDNAFSGCNLLQSVYLPDSLENIGHEAFSGCESIKSIELNGCKVCDDAFIGCGALEEILVPYGDLEYYQEMLPSLKDKIVSWAESIMYEEGDTSELDFIF